MSYNTVIEANSISKVYPLFEKPHHCLKRILKDKFQKSRVSSDNTKDDREFWALKNVSIELRQNETLGIIGQNGSGKSTLLQIICGTLTPTIGEKKTKGRVAALLELGAGFNPEYTGRENVYLNASLYGLSTKEVDDRIDNIIAFAEIGEHIDQPVKTYSSGMYVRLAFSVIANIDADILVIDEALAVGDAYFQQKCMRFLKKFKEHGSIFFVSHDTTAMINFCDRVVWIHKGELIANGNPKLICEEYLSFLHQENSGQQVSLENETKKDNAETDCQLSRSFGDRKAIIERSTLLNRNYNQLISIGQAEPIILRVSIEINENLESTIVGFIVKDRLGQYLFGDNTYSRNVELLRSLKKGDKIDVDFRFEMPELTPGVYSIATAIASGTPDCHIQHHWVHESVVFNSISSIDTGILFRVNMDGIECTKQ